MTASAARRTAGISGAKNIRDPESKGKTDHSEPLHLEAAPGFEPGMTVLQTVPNPGIPTEKAACSSSTVHFLTPELKEIGVAWPKLPEPLRAGILAMVRAALGR